MHTPTALAALAAIASLIAAKPLPQAARDRHYAARALHKRASFPTGFGPAPLKKVANTTVEDGGPAKTSSTDDAADTEYSTNWSGSIFNAASGEAFSSAVGTVTIPSCSDPNDGSTGPWYNTYWVGIDGTSDSNGLLQAGVICEIDTDGTESYYPWVEYFPDPLITIDGFSVSEGDSVTISIDVLSPTSGSLVLSDSTNGQSFTTTLGAPAATNTLVGESAEWILEDFSSNGGLVPFAAFSPCTWTASTGTYQDGSSVGATDDGWNPTLLQNSAGTTITSVDADASDSLTINYTG